MSFGFGSIHPHFHPCLFFKLQPKFHLLSTSWAGTFSPRPVLTSPLRPCSFFAQLLGKIDWQAQGDHMGCWLRLLSLRARVCGVDAQEAIYWIYDLREIA